LRVSIKRPSDCAADEINDFCAVVSSGGKVSPDGLRDRILRATYLAFCHQGGRLLGVAALKDPVDSYRERVFAKAGVSSQDAETETEFGYAFTLSECRGRGVGTQILSELVAIAAPAGIFATAEVESGMSRLLRKHGFIPVGQPYSGAHTGSQIQLCIKSPELTGQAYIQPAKEAAPSCTLPTDLNTPLWRYISLRKFRSLLKSRCLYLCRADRLHDKFEGRYSRDQVEDMNSWLHSTGHPSLAESEKTRRIKDRRRCYISCWCMGECDLDLMWKGYVGRCAGVALRSCVWRLQRLCDESVEYFPLDLSLVKYADLAGGEHCDYMGLPSAVLHKDSHFRLDNEARIVHWPNMQQPEPSHIMLPINAPTLLTGVVCSPRCRARTVRRIRKWMDKAGLAGLPLEFSRDDRGVTP